MDYALDSQSQHCPVLLARRVLAKAVPGSTPKNLKWNALAGVQRAEIDKDARSSDDGSLGEDVNRVMPDPPSPCAVGSLRRPSVLHEQNRAIKHKILSLSSRRAMLQLLELNC
jgi:hypothetical protein